MYFKPVVVDQHFKRIIVLAFFSFLLSLDDYVPLSHLKFVFLAVLGIKLEVARIKIGFEARLRPLGQSARQPHKNDSFYLFTDTVKLQKFGSFCVGRFLISFCCFSRKLSQQGIWRGKEIGAFI